MSRHPSKEEDSPVRQEELRGEEHRRRRGPVGPLVTSGALPGDGLRAALGGRALAEAGSVIALLSSVDLSQNRLNVVVHDVGHAHVPAILFDAEADFATVQVIGREAKKMIADTLEGSLH